MNSASAEYKVAYNYVEWLCDLPWNRPRRHAGRRRGAASPRRGSTTASRSQEAHLSTSRSASSRPTSEALLCFVGPPGVGKTSLGRSIARATGREFQRIALGGSRTRPRSAAIA